MPAAATKKTETLADALVAFQANLPEVTLDGVNPHFKSKFATLANVTKKVLPELSKHGLAFSVGSFVDNGVLIVDAHLIHTSGESRSLQFPIPGTDPQKIGSALSYARRYALTSLTGVVADEDDDGNAASAGPSQSDRKIAAAQTQQPKAPATGPSADVKKVQAQIKETFIDTGKFTKDEVNETFESLKKTSGKTGYDLWVAVGQDLRARSGETGE